MFCERFSAGGTEKWIFSPHSIVTRTAHGTQQAPERRRREKFVFDNFPADSLSGCIEQQVGRCRSLVVLASFCLSAANVRRVIEATLHMMMETDVALWLFFLSCKRAGEVIKSWNQSQLWVTWRELKWFISNISTEVKFSNGDNFFCNRN